MWRRRRCVAACACLALTAALPAGAQAVVVSGTGVRAVDGDTLVARVGSRSVIVDLAGIAAPQAGDCFARTARRRLQGFAAGGAITIDTGAAAFGTRTRRVRGVVFLTGRRATASFNLALVRAGLAEVAGAGRLTIARALRRAEEQAVDRGRGIWGDGCDVGQGAPRGSGTPPPAPPPPPPGQPAVAIPAGWVITAGSPTTFPVPAGQSRDQLYAQVSAALAEVDRRVRGGRQLFFSEALGAPGPIVTTEISLDLCSDRTFRRHFQTSLPPQVEDTTGTWRITIDLAAPNGPFLERTVTGGGVFPEVLDLQTSASGVLLGNRSFTTAPSAVCT